VHASALSHFVICVALCFRSILNHTDLRLKMLYDLEHAALLQQALASSNGEIPALPGIQQTEEVSQRAAEIKEGMEVELTSRVSCAGTSALLSWGFLKP
jgi:hypothetical protein